MTLRVVPCTVRQATAYVHEHHRHLKRGCQGALFAAALADEDGAWHGAALAGNPARVWQGTGRIVITRVATDGAKNACSALYGALCRAAKALGYREAWTYTLPEEPGTSLRAAGFVDMGLTKGGTHSRKGRPRQHPERDGPKRRWLRVLRQEPV